MKSQLLKQIRTIFSPKQVKLNKRIIYFLTFLTLSTIIWFFNKLEKNYFSQISISVKYYNFPKNVIQTEELPSKITLTIYGRGFTILRYKLLSMASFYIDLSKYLNSTYNGNEIVLLYTENLISALNKELPEEVKIIQIEPRSIKFSFAKKQTKKLPIIPRISYQIAKGYILTDFSIKPDFALITGPVETLDTIDTLYTVYFKIGQLQNSKNLKIQLQPLRNCEINPQNAELNFTIDKKTEKIIKIPVSHFFTNNEKIHQVIPDYIKLTCHVAVSKYHETQIESFQIKLKQSTTNNQKIIYYYPKIEKMPKGVSHAKFHPEYFTVIYK